MLRISLKKIICNGIPFILHRRYTITVRFLLFNIPEPLNFFFCLIKKGNKPSRVLKKKIKFLFLKIKKKKKKKKKKIKNF